MFRRFLKRILPARLAEKIKYALIPDEVRLIDLYCRTAQSLTGRRVMIDVGAHEGSSLLPFAALNWQVYAFEPDPQNRQALLDKVNGSAWVTVDDRAVSDKDGEELPFYASEVSSGISGLNAFHESHVPVGTVTTVTLASYIESQSIDQIDFLKVDTEGYELFVLKGIAWERIKPGIILLEYEDAKTVPLGYSMPDLAKILLDQDYSVLLSEWQPIKQYGRSHSWKRIVPFPATDWNSAGWGNLIAFQDRRDHDGFLKLYRRCRAGWKIGNALNKLVS